MTPNQKQRLKPLLKKLVMEVKNELKEEPVSGQSKPVRVGSKVITIGMTKGTVYVYNRNMTQVLCQFTPVELELLLKMSKRKNTEE